MSNPLQQTIEALADRIAPPADQARAYVPVDDPELPANLPVLRGYGLEHPLVNVAGHQPGQGRLADLAGTGHEHHLPRQIPLNLRDEVPGLRAESRRRRLPRPKASRSSPRSAGINGPPVS